MIRFATPEDAQAIAEVHVAAWRAAYRGIVPTAYLVALSVEERTAGWEGRINADPRGLLLSENDGHISGWVAFGAGRDEPAPDRAEVYALYISPDRWRRGLGRTLTLRAEEDLWSRGFRHISLWVFDRNKAARAFYEKAGYVADGANRTLTFGDAAVAEIRYTKKRREPEIPST